MITERMLNEQPIEARGLDESSTLVNYYVGKGEDWRTGVRTYETVGLNQVWPGIDVQLKDDENNVKKGFHRRAGRKRRGHSICGRWSAEREHQRNGAACLGN